MNSNTSLSHPSSPRLGARSLLLSAAASCTLVLGACASQGKPPEANLAVARTSVSQAEAVNAPQLAPIEYRNARDKLIRAEEAMRSERYNDARVLADESAADADLAQRKAQAMKAASNAQDLQRSNAILNSELNRTQQTTTQTTTVTPAGGAAQPTPGTETTRRTQTTTTITTPATPQ